MKFAPLSGKFRLFFPIMLGAVVSVIIVTIFSINTAIKSIYESTERSLSLEVMTIIKMFEREKALKQEKVKTDLKVAHRLFYQYPLQVMDKKISLPAENQITGEIHQVEVNQWMHNQAILHKDVSFVDNAKELFGGTITIFQKIDKGYLRISTNVPRSDGSRAIGTYIPNESEVIKTIEKGETYYGRAYVVNDWYITAYEPIYFKDVVIGILYVGGKEKDLEELSKIINELKIGKNGQLLIFDDHKEIVFKSANAAENILDTDLKEEIIQSKKGVLKINENGNSNKKIIVYDHFDDFKLNIAAIVNARDETIELINKIIFSSVIIALVIVVLLSIFVYLVTTETIHKYLLEAEKSNRQLSITRAALEQSEKLASMGQLTAGIAAEVSNPLEKILVVTRILKDEVDKESSIYGDIEAIAQQAEKTKNILSGLLHFAQLDQISMKETNIRELFEMAMENAKLPETVNTIIEFKLESQLAFVDTTQILQLITILLNNALEAIENKGSIEIHVKTDKNELVFSISDNGKGISDENIDKLFVPFYSTKESGQGSGLGLSISYGIVQMHKGKIEVNSNTDPSKGKTGTSFKVTIPLNN